MKHHIEDVKHHHTLHDQNLLILSETWLSMNDTNDQNNQYELPDYKAHYCNAGNGKGVVGYSDKTFHYEDRIVEDSHQILKYSTCFRHDMT